MISGSVILVTAAFTYVSAIVDAEHINKKQYIDSHVSRGFLRGMFFCATGFSDPLNAIASSFLFWALFDQALNLERKLPFWYLGTVAKTDIFFSNKKWLYISIKISSLILSLYLFLK